MDEYTGQVRNALQILEGCEVDRRAHWHSHLVNLLWNGSWMEMAGFDISSVKTLGSVTRLK